MMLVLKVAIHCLRLIWDRKNNSPIWPLKILSGLWKSPVWKPEGPLHQKVFREDWWRFIIACVIWKQIWAKINKTSVCETRMPRWQQSQTMAKISKSYILTRPPPGACDVSEVWTTLRWTYSPSLVTVSSPKL